MALASLVGDAAETYDLTNIGTLFAFALVCAGVLVLRVKEPDRPRPFRVPFVWVVAPLGIAACLFVMVGLPRQAWERFGIWLGHRRLAYGYRHSRLRSGLTVAQPRGPTAVDMKDSGFTPGIPGSRYGARLDRGARRPRS